LSVRSAYSLIYSFETYPAENYLIDRISHTGTGAPISAFTSPDPFEVSV